MPSHPGRVILFALLVTALAASAEQPPPPCHPNPDAAADSATVAARGDVASLPQPLKNKLVRLADRPHSILPVQARAEADAPSQLFQSYLLDTTGLEPNVFTRIFERFALTREINDGLLAPRFSPSQWAWVLSGTRVAVNPAVPVSAGRDADDR